MEAPPGMRAFPTEDPAATSVVVLLLYLWQALDEVPNEGSLAVGVARIDGRLAYILSETKNVLMVKALGQQVPPIGELPEGFFAFGIATMFSALHKLQAMHQKQEREKVKEEGSNGDRH